MISNEDKRIAYRTIEKLRKNPPKVTQEHRDGAKKLLEQHKANEAEKDRDIRREVKDFSKDLAGFVHTHLNGVGELFHGIGDGKKVDCSHCGNHSSQMYNMNDGKWYCHEHRWLGDLNDEERKRRSRI